MVNIGDRSKPKQLVDAQPILFPDQQVAVMPGKHKDTRTFSFFSLPLVVGACAEANSDVATSNNDRRSLFQTRTGPFLIDSFVFFAKVLAHLGYEWGEYKTICSGGRWSQDMNVKWPFVKRFAMSWCKTCFLFAHHCELKIQRPRGDGTRRGPGKPYFIYSEL